MAKGICNPESADFQCERCGTMFTRRNPAQRYCGRACAFWAKVDVRGPNECWEWQASLRKGYGRFWGHPSHRYAWELANGREMPKEMLACHRCDNPPCCNPAHIWPGTPGENTRDSVIKARRVGEGIGRNKLTERDVRKIVEAIKRGDLPKAIARRFGCHSSNVQRIKGGFAWTHITGGPVMLSSGATARMKQQILEIQVAGIRAAASKRRTKDAR